MIAGTADEGRWERRGARDDSSRGGDTSAGHCSPWRPHETTIRLQVRRPSARGSGATSPQSFRPVSSCAGLATMTTRRSLPRRRATHSAVSGRPSRVRLSGMEPAGVLDQRPIRQRELMGMDHPGWSDTCGGSNPNRTLTDCRRSVSSASGRYAIFAHRSATPRSSRWSAMRPRAVMPTGSAVAMVRPSAVKAASGTALGEAAVPGRDQPCKASHLVAGLPGELPGPSAHAPAPARSGRCLAENSTPVM